MNNQVIACAAACLLLGPASLLAEDSTAKQKTHSRHIVAEDDEIPWDKLRESTSRYLDACVPNQTRQSMSKKMKARINQRVKDTGASAEQAAREIMLDWAAANSDKLARKEPRALAQVCFYFDMFMEKGFSISSQIRERLTPNICQEIIEFLDEEVKSRTPKP